MKINEKEAEERPIEKWFLILRYHFLNMSFELLN